VLGTEAAAQIAADVFGAFAGTITALGSQHDANFLLDDGGASGRHLLKVAHPSTRAIELEAQSLAAAHFAERAPDVAAPRTWPALDGALVSTVELDGVALHVRRLSFVEGTPLSSSRYLAPSVVARLGEFAARSVIALRDFEHPGVERDLEWDLRNAARLVDDLLPFVADPLLADRIRSAVDEAWETVSALGERLPRQVIHGDITDDNVVATTTSEGRPEPVGIIDFGDVMRSWTIGELAVTCSSVLHHHGATPVSALPAVRAFDALRPLAPEEIDAFWPLVVARAATLVVSAHHAATTDPGNEYARANFAHEHRIFEVATSVPAPVMTALVRAALGAAPQQPDAAELRGAGALVPGVDARTAAVLDLSSTSDGLGGGRFQDPDAESILAAGALAAGAPAAVTTFGERRLTRSFRESFSPHDCVALGVTVALPNRQHVHAPWAGALTRSHDGRLLLTTSALVLELTGVTPDDALGLAPATPEEPGAGSTTGNEASTRDVGAGTRIGHVSAPLFLDGDPERRLEVALGVRLLRTTLDRSRVPSFTTVDLAPGWASIALDPAALLFATPLANSTPTAATAGAPAPAGSPAPSSSPANSTTASAAPTPDTPSADELLTRRARSLADVQEHYYARPPEIERGWRHHLFDTDARPYLDMVNNVASVGHAHPRITAAVSRQLALLNTNSRFNYRAIVDLSERLAGLLPDPLDTVFLVNSGTEAVDLALRIAWAWTNRRDIVAVREAYHGWSDASDAISTSVADNPQALETRPEWVHTVDAPNAYRGVHRGPETHRYAEEAVAAVARLIENGRPPAAFIAEAFYGNAGGMPLPEGYLEAVYPAIRAGGGVCIADEVQVGYGRLGDVFWGFQQQGVVPDIVTVAKAMGNGHPLGAVVTRRDMAQNYRSEGYFFSSAGGSPVSSVVGTTVLDILRDEGLQENARVVGAHLKARLGELAERHAIIGAVHGLGLYLGVELVRDRDTLEPATAETAAICERMLELGVIVQPTSDRQCVLKIKPPLTITVESADFFADALDDVLTHGW
jgi:4-aminobutyrate aminotransferase-like enzyme/Ser/Thr protein kinase RdoA (MazF antagonist)